MMFSTRLCGPFKMIHAASCPTLKLHRAFCTDIVSSRLLLSCVFAQLPSRDHG